MNDQINGSTSELRGGQSQEIVALLNRLIQACFDAQEGFGHAAQLVQDFELRALFNDAAQLRSVMAEDLVSLVRGLDGDPIAEGAAVGNLRRGWMALKMTFAEQPDVAVLADCRRGEESTVEIFRQVLEESLPPEANALVRRQFSVVVATCERLKSLEKALSTE
jgi:uncharacterized protein (TIGR02284 family)